MIYGSKKALNHFKNYGIPEKYAAILLDAIGWYTGGIYQPYPSEGWMPHYKGLTVNFMMEELDPVLYIYWLCFKSQYGMASLKMHPIITKQDTVQEFKTWAKNGKKIEIEFVKFQLNHHITSHSALPIVLCELKLVEGTHVSQVEKADAANKLMAVPDLRGICVNSNKLLKEEGIVWIT